MPDSKRWFAGAFLLAIPLLIGCHSKTEEKKISAFADEEECDTSFTENLRDFMGIGWRKGEKEERDLKEFISGKKILVTPYNGVFLENFYPDGRWSSLTVSGSGLQDSKGEWNVDINDRGYPVLCTTFDRPQKPGPFCRDVVISANGRYALLSSNSTPSGEFFISSYRICEIHE